MSSVYPGYGPNVKLELTALETDNAGTITKGYSTANGVVVSEPFNLQDATSFGVQCFWTSTGTVTGAFTIEVTALEGPDATTNSHWDAPSNNTFPADVASNDSHTYEDFYASGAAWGRVKYTATAGADGSNRIDTMSVVVNVKRNM